MASEDGTLLISIGDATSNHGTDIGGDSLGTFVSQALELGIIGLDQDLGSYKSQYLGSYSGKILRIDAKNGDGLASNPFFDPELAPLQELEFCLHRQRHEELRTELHYTVH